MYIAGKIKSNIRELEGSLIRLIARRVADRAGDHAAAHTGGAKNILTVRLKRSRSKPIQEFVAPIYNLKMIDLKARNNAKSVSKPRQDCDVSVQGADACVAAGNRAQLWREASFYLVIHSIRKVEDLRKKEPDFNTLIGNFLEGFR